MVNCLINKELVESVRFPITDVGTSSSIEMILENPTMWDIELVPYVNDPEVSIKDYPRKLKAYESGKCIWTFSPSKERLSPLDCKCGFREVIG